MTDTIAPTVRIVLVDDHAIVRQGIASMLEREADLLVVGEAANAAEAIEVIRGNRPDVVVLDLKLSTGVELEGIELCRRIVAEDPTVRVLVLTTFLDHKLVVAAIQAGARGYVLKDVDPTELVRALRSLSQGHDAFDQKATDLVVSSLRSVQDAPPRYDLTEREREVLRLLAHGLSNHAIGKELFISEATVKFHVSNLMRKLQVTRRAEAVYAASKTGLI